MFGPLLAPPHARIEPQRIKMYLACKLNHNTLFVLVAVYLEQIDLKLPFSFPQYCKRGDNNNDDDKIESDDQDGNLASDGGI